MGRECAVVIRWRAPRLSFRARMIYCEGKLPFLSLARKRPNVLLHVHINAQPFGEDSSYAASASAPVVPGRAVSPGHPRGDECWRLSRSIWSCAYTGHDAGGRGSRLFDNELIFLQRTQDVPRRTIVTVSELEKVLCMVTAYGRGEDSSAMLHDYTGQFGI